LFENLIVINASRALLNFIEEIRGRDFNRIKKKFVAETFSILPKGELKSNIFFIFFFIFFFYFSFPIYRFLYEKRRVHKAPQGNFLAMESLKILY